MKKDKHFNFCRSVVVDLEYIIKRFESGVLVKNNPEWKDDLKAVTETAKFILPIVKSGQKFILPRNADIVNDMDFVITSTLPSLRLPFSEVCLEFEIKYQDNSSIEPRVICLKEFLDDNTIYGAVLEKVPAHGGSIWVPIIEMGIPIVDGFGEEEGKLGLAAKVQPIGSAKYGDDVLGYAFTTVTNFLAALAMTNVSYKTSKGRKLSKKAKKKKAIPFDDYKVLTIGGVKVDGRMTIGGTLGVSSSKREHLRRGHVRNYSSGKVVWVNPTIVNPGVGGKIKKKYKLKPSKGKGSTV